MHTWRTHIWPRVSIWRQLVCVRVYFHSACARVGAFSTSASQAPWHRLRIRLDIGFTFALTSASHYHNIGFAFALTSASHYHDIGFAFILTSASHSFWHRLRRIILASASHSSWHRLRRLRASICECLLDIGFAVALTSASHSSWHRLCIHLDIGFALYWHRLRINWKLYRNHITSNNNITPTWPPNSFKKKCNLHLNNY